MTTFVTGVPGWLGNRFLEVLTSPDDPAYKYNQHENRQIKCLVLPQVLPWLRSRKNVEYLAGDITRPDTLVGKMKGVDVVYHIAGIIHPKKIQDLYNINTEGTRNVLNEAIRSGVKRFIYISSNSIAGVNKSSEDLFDENCPITPYMNYGKSKWSAEKLVRDAGDKGLIETVVLRPCWFYGPNQPARQTRFFNMISSGNPIIFGSGKNLRSMSYVDNTIQAMLLAENNPAAKNQVYWIADERPYETIEIYETVAKILGVNLKPRFVPGVSSFLCRCADYTLQTAGFYISEFHVAGEMNQNIACSIEKAKKELGYKPEVSLEDGMRRSIQWCKDHGHF
jgi:nucleoside-diphosphate-sugar epimerase